jgi:uncharacterized membrane protein YphA (DoxX/SURF4 family)
VSTADVLALVVAALFLVTGGVKLLGVEASLTIRDHFAMSPRLWQVIGVLECSGAIGTALGIWAKPLGVLALLGLVGLMLGAVVILLAMMASKGTSVLRSVYVINRGYEDLATRLNDLGANIETFRDI